MHVLNDMTSEERTRYFEARAHWMKTAHPVEKFRLWCHPVHDWIFMIGLLLAFTIYGLPIAFCLMSLGMWVQSNHRRSSFWIFLSTIPISLVWLVLLVEALVRGTL